MKKISFLHFGETQTSFRGEICQLDGSLQDLNFLRVIGTFFFN